MYLVAKKNELTFKEKAVRLINRWWSQSESIILVIKR